jgi:hypothetical protein
MQVSASRRQATAGVLTARLGLGPTRLTGGSGGCP